MKRRCRQPSRQGRRCGRLPAAVRTQRRRHLADAKAGQGGLHHHFTRELHALSSQSKPEDGASLETAQSAMKIPDRRGKKPSAYEGERGIADVAVEPWHRPRSYPALKAIADHKLESVAQGVHEGIEIREVIGIIRIAHDDVSAPGRGDSTDEGGAVSLRPIATTRAPAASASACEPSRDPLSATSTSPEMPRCLR